MRVAFSELREANATARRRAIGSGLLAAPHSLALRAFEYHALATSADSAALATSIESCTELFPSEIAKGRYYLTAAEVWARRTQDSTSARAALAQAALYGTEQKIVNRTARLLASELNDVSLVR